MIGYVELEEAKKFLEVRYSNINEENLKRALYNHLGYYLKLQFCFLLKNYYKYYHQNIS